MRDGRMMTLVVGIAMAVAATACDSTSSSDARPEELLVSAAASLSDVMTEVAFAFEAEHSGVDVRVNLAGSSTLREQVLAGAPVDVLASASRTAIEPVVAAGLVAAPTAFATNRLVVAVPPGNPAGIARLADLADPDLLVGVCAEGVPCGDLAREVFAATGVTPSLDTETADVRALVTRLALGELDVGLVYATDVVAVGGAVEQVPAGDLPADGDLETTYVVAPLRDAPNAVAAQAFVDFLLSDRGLAVMAAHGFGPP